MKCEACNGTGWIQSQRNGYDFSARCKCNPPKAPKPEKQHRWAVKRGGKKPAPLFDGKAAATEREQTPTEDLW